jgi:hypothetical protein
MTMADVLPIVLTKSIDVGDSIDARRGQLFEVLVQAEVAACSEAQSSGEGGVLISPSVVAIRVMVVMVVIV